MNGRSYYPNYFSIENILATEEKVPCTTKINFTNMGFLCNESTGADLKEGVTLNVPIWVAQKLSGKHIKYLKTDIPNLLKENVWEVFGANSQIVDLYKLSPYFYEFGLIFSRIKYKHSEILRQLLIMVFRERFRKIFAWAMNGMKDPFQIQELDISEQYIFEEGQKANDLHNEWFLELQIRIKPADVVVHIKRRKRIEDSFALEAAT